MYFDILDSNILTFLILDGANFCWKVYFGCWCFYTPIWGKLFSETARVAMPDRQPGGWSARGQPCDAVHSVYRRHMTEYSETCLGYRTPLLERVQGDVLLMSNGNPHLALSHRDSVVSAIFGWKKLSKQRHLLRRCRSTPKCFEVYSVHT